MRADPRSRPAGRNLAATRAVRLGPGHNGRWLA
jgi:hypothetical protein